MEGVQIILDATKYQYYSRITSIVGITRQRSLLLYVLEPRPGLLGYGYMGLKNGWLVNEASEIQSIG